MAALKAQLMENALTSATRILGRLYKGRMVRAAAHAGQRGLADWKTERLEVHAERPGHAVQNHCARDQRGAAVGFVVAVPAEMNSGAGDAYVE